MVNREGHQDYDLNEDWRCCGLEVGSMIDAVSLGYPRVPKDSC